MTCQKKPKPNLVRDFQTRFLWSTGIPEELELQKSVLSLKLHDGRSQFTKNKQ